jgi:hypothetical protein
MKRGTVPGSERMVLALHIAATKTLPGLSTVLNQGFGAFTIRARFRG